MTKVVTFYSYKGGVGRTMALVNTAHVLARDGWRVLMLDLDLEAPGMTYFFADQVRRKASAGGRDAIDLLMEAKTTLGLASTPRRDTQLRSLSEYVVSIDVPPSHSRDALRVPYLRGRLDLLPATLEPQAVPEADPTRDYLRRMDALDLSAVFSAAGPRHRFGEHLRQILVGARFEAAGDILFTMREQVQAAYDIVLVDSRTGLNEISGLCIGPLCDAIVVCCSLNRQNIEGTRYFLARAGLLNSEKAKPFIVAAGPVPVWHTRVAEDRLKAMRKAFGDHEIVQIPYHPSAAIEETVFVTKELNEPITTAYEQLAPRVAGMLNRPRFPEQLFELARHAPSGQSLGEHVAPLLGELRLSPGKVTLRGWLASIPSACTMSGLPKPDDRRFLPEPSDEIARAAAVAAYRLKSDVPFNRAFALSRGMNRKGDDDHAIALGLTYFQLKVLGTLNTNGLGILKQLVNRSSSAATEEFLGGHWETRNPYLDALLIAVDAKARGVLPDDIDVSHGRHLIIKLAAGGRKSLFRDAAYEWAAFMQHLWRGDPPEFEEYLAASMAVLGMVPGIESVTPVKRLIARLRKIPAEQLMAGAEHYATDEEPEFMLGGSRRGRERRGPLGTPPDVITVSVLALARGVEAVSEIVAWLRVVRRLHGYAWRVLVDTRHLESVRDHPEYKTFVAEEDASVERVESMIDRGVYTL